MVTGIPGRMTFGILGSLDVRDASGRPVTINGRQARTVLTMLLAAAGRAVAVEALVDAIWRDDPPDSANGTLQSYVSRLRRRFDDAGGPAIVLDPAGYHIDVEPDDVDLTRFETLASRGSELLRGGRTAEARDLLAEAEALWRGPALLDLADVERVAGLIVRLEERRLLVVEERVGADLALGRHAGAVGELRELVAAHPLQDGFRAQLARALYATNRQAEALRVLSDGSRILRDELGLEPSQVLRDLELAILGQDGSLVSTADPATPAIESLDRGSGLPHAPTSDRAPRASPLVGRQHELVELIAAFDESAEESRFVVIEGDPGIGKTYLAEAARRACAGRGATTVWGRSDEGGATPALWPWLVPLRLVADRVGSTPDSVAQLLAGDAPGATGQAAAVQFERFEAVTQFLEAAAAESPLVILFDDLQWADSTSLDLLGFLATRLGAGVLIVATMRQLEIGRQDALTDALAAVTRRAGSRRFVLRGLSVAETATVVGTASRPVAPAVAEAIHARSDGNPFYAIELARLAGDAVATAESVPATVGEVIRRRLAVLPDATRELLVIAAVSGRDVDVQLLARIGGLDIAECIDRIEPAVVRRVLIDVPEQPSLLRFSHALVREVLVDGVNALRRARLHLQVADAIEASGAGTDDAEILAEHLFRAAALGVGQRAAAALERAAEVALSRVSYVKAEEMLTRAAQLRRVGRGSDADLRAELATVSRLLEVTGLTRASRYFQHSDQPLLDRAMSLADALGERDQLLRLRWFEWAGLAAASQLHEMRRVAGEVVTMTTDDPRPHVRASAHGVRGVSLWSTGDLAAALEELDQFAALMVDAPPPGDPLEAEHFLTLQLFWIYHNGLCGSRSAAETFAAFDAVVFSMPDGAAAAAICGFAVTTACALGSYEDVVRYVRLGLESDSSEFGLSGGQMPMGQGIVAAREGKIDEALESFALGKQRYLGLGARSGLATNEATLAGLVAHHGRVSNAELLVHNARVELDTYDERWNEPVVLIAEAEVAHAAGNDARASERIMAAVERATTQGSNALARRAADVATTLSS